MSEMVERVAKAIKRGIADDLPSADIARAAIEAMREPTEAMLHAGYDGLGREAAQYTGPEDVWPRMIDAALKD